MAKTTATTKGARKPAAEQEEKLKRGTAPEDEDVKESEDSEEEDSDENETDEEEADEDSEEEDSERLSPGPKEALAEVKDRGDYLRQYQYKKVNNTPVIGGVETDPDKGSKAELMKAKLLTQPVVSIFIPRAEGEDKKVKLSVNLNGYRLDLPKNEYLELPRQVADVIMESQKQQAVALQPFQISGDKEKENALT